MFPLAGLMIGTVALFQPIADELPEQRAAADPQQLNLTSVQLFTLAEAALENEDFATAEAAFRALADDPDPEIRAEARFRLGMMFARQRRYTDAAITFRQLLDEKPDAARVRVELARILALMGDMAAARRELRQAQAAGLPPEVALVVDQFANALRARRPFGGSLSLAVVPDSNINRATDRETLDTIIAPLELSEDAREQAGIGVRVGAQGYLRLPLGQSVSLLPRLSGQAELYRQGQFNDISASAALGLEVTSGRDRINPTLAHSLRYYGGDYYAATQSASVSWLRPFGTRAQAQATATVSRADYRQNDLQDGWLYDLSASYERALDARSGGGVTVNVTRQTARDPGYATTSAGATLLYAREVGRASLFGTANIRRLIGDERLFLYPDKRREWLIGASAGASFRHIVVEGFAPLVRVSYERNFSTVGIYDYSRLAVDFGITRAF